MSLGLALYIILPLMLLVAILLWRGSKHRSVKTPRSVLISNGALTIAILVAFSLALLRHVVLGGKDVDLTWARQERSLSKAIVLLHGWSGSSETWQPFLSIALADPRLTDFEFLTASYPTLLNGQGRSVAEIADELMKQMHAKLPNRQIIILAHSLGGVIARRMVLLEAASGHHAIVAVTSAGSPYLGADVAALGSQLNAPESFFSELRQASMQVRAMDVDWRNFRAGAHKQSMQDQCVASAVDGRQTDGVVTVQSALHACASTILTGGWSHRDLARPVNAADPRYQAHVDFILLVSNR